MNSDVVRNKYPAAKVFCNPKFLQAFQCSPHRPFQDSKTLVDCQLRHDPEVILQAFAKFPTNPNANEYQEFLKWAFILPSENTTSIQTKDVPKDFNEDLPSFAKNNSPNESEFLKFTKDLKKRWLQLARKHVIPTGSKDWFVRSSLIPLPYTYFIPGGRFRECYYWDTLWIVKGLLASDMIESAQDAVRNLLHLVDTIGFVPNGNRIYYLNRSQPPMLTEAVSVVYDTLHEQDEKIAWLRETIDILEKEYQQFVQSHTVRNTTSGKKSTFESLSVFYVQSGDPRPESFKEDSETREKVQNEDKERQLVDEDKFYRDIAAAAESGWDFSSRWFPHDGDEIKNIRTTDIIPCCLNGILLKVERTLSQFHEILLENSSNTTAETTAKHRKSADFYKNQARLRAKDMMEVMWNEKYGFWQDFDMITGNKTDVISAAGIIPAWAGCWEGYWNDSDARKFVEFVTLKSELLQNGGLSSTMNKSKEQWDFPNCWPPLVDFAVEGLMQIDAKFPESGAKKAAEEIAKRFVTTVFNGWLKDGEIHEKYDSRFLDGSRGVGGEYEPQTGFGWTNGVVLWLSKSYWDKIESDWIRLDEN